jgi:glycosyltransferase involved in cell wall biosynthesis
MSSLSSNYKVGIDTRMISHSGIGVRLYHLLSYLTKKSIKPDIYLFGDPELLKKYTELSIYKIIPYYAKVYSISELLGHSEMKNMDLLDIPHFNYPLPYINKCIVTIHDLTPYVMRNFFPSKLKRLYLQIILRLLRYSKKIISVSDFTAKDLETYFGYPISNTKVIYNAVDHKVFYPRSENDIIAFKKKYNLPNEYYLAVGIGKGHKNFQFLIDSLYSKYKSGEIKISLVIAGTNGVVPDYIQKKIIGIENSILFLSKIPYEELPFLYGGAKCLLYPSLYEGFGLPLVEAQASNCPIVSSNASVMPEILENSALFFDPTKPLELIEALNNLETFSSEFKQKGLDNAKRFTWDSSVDQLIEVYERSYHKK